LSHGAYFYVLLGADPLHCMQLLAESAYRYLKRGLYVGISMPASLKDNLHHVARQAQIACDLNILKSDNPSIQVYTPLTSFCSKETGKLLSQLEEALIGCNTARCQLTLEAIKKEILNTGSIKIFLRTLYRITMILGQYDESMLEGEIYNTLLSIDRLDKIFLELDKQFANMCIQIPNLIPQNMLHVEKAKHYILSNLSQNIKLKDVSAHLYLSPNYLGRLFFKKTGIYLTDYIISERIALACKLLQEKPLSISDAATGVGITDPQYFSKIFKKNTGMTPKEYARRFAATKE